VIDTEFFVYFFVYFIYFSKTISHDKKELQELLVHYHIYVDNPCCILTQEESKKFIQGDDKDKFRFFMKATGLQLLFEKIRECAASLQVTEAESEKSKATLEEKKKEVKEWKVVLVKLEKLSNFDTEINKLFVKALWRDVAEAEKVVLDAKDSYEGLLETTEKAQRILEEKRSKNDDSDKRLEELKAEQNEATKEIDNEIAEQLKTLSLASNESKRKMYFITSEISKVNSSKSEFQQRYKSSSASVNTLYYFDS
jgi:chromosome segregation ATPase